MDPVKDRLGYSPYITITQLNSPDGTVLTSNQEKASLLTKKKKMQVPVLDLNPDSNLYTDDYILTFSSADEEMQSSIQAISQSHLDIRSSGGL